MNKKSSLRSFTQGFTLVELLIVIVVMGILVTITFATYRGLQQRAQSTATQEDLATIARQMRVYQIKHGGYPATLADAGISVKNTSYQYTNSGSTFCITGTNGSVSYKLDSTSSPTPTPVAGGCPGHGVNGIPPVTNLATNPGAESSTSGYTCYNCNMARDTSWNASGTASFSTTPSGASNDSFIALGGDLGGFRTGLQAGKTYTISATVRLTAAQTGTLGGNGSRQITAWYTNGGHTLVRGSQAPNAAGQQRVSVTYSIPATATAAWIRLYNGASVGNGVVWWDNIMITEGPTQYNYADGNTANWLWSGTQNLSTSYGPSP